ncbi:hypothetical protein LLL17_004304 [Salmonella enterica]|nr:hypothetical protein [Salmonella enterica]EIH1704438.1 hypothetical protein [Salmonella enterica]EIL4130170.1 hypothetical protein [Salmonella enterica]
MAFWDNQDLNFGGDDYNPTQSNVLGQNLAPINNQGTLAATDAQNDLRTPEQYKQDAQLANSIATNAPDEDDNYITSQNGNKYEKVNNSKWDQSLAAAATYMSTYFATGGNVGKAGIATGQALYDMDAKAHRLGQADKLEGQGFNSLDIQNWINSGDKKDLVTNKGQWQSGGNGVMFNNLTGETRQIPGATNPNAPVKTVDLGDRKVLYYADGRQEEVAKGAAPKFQAAGAGGSIGLDEDENGGFVLENGQWVQHTTYANGRPKTVVANATQQKQLNAQQAAGQPDAQQTQMSGDLATLSTAIDNGQVGTFTGQVVSRLPGAVSEVASSTMGSPEERQAFNAATRIEGNMQNMGIAAATQMGASGINTEAEAERYFKSMPRLDKSSPDALKASVNAIQAYTQNYNSKKAATAGAKPAAPQGVTHVERGPDGKLRIVGG